MYQLQEEEVEDSGDDIPPRMTPTSVLENWKDVGTVCLDQKHWKEPGLVCVLDGGCQGLQDGIFHSQWL